MGSEYWIIYYRDPVGYSPVEDFIEKLPVKDKAKVMAYLSLLKERGFLPFPYTSDLKTARKLRELRIRFSARHYRIIYFMASEKRLVLLHVFSKKSREIPKEEIEIAQKRMSDFQRREML